MTEKEREREGERRRGREKNKELKKTEPTYNIPLSLPSPLLIVPVIIFITVPILFSLEGLILSIISIPLFKQPLVPTDNKYIIIIIIIKYK